MGPWGYMLGIRPNFYESCHFAFVWFLFSGSIFMAVHTTRVSMEVIVTIVSKLVYFTYLRDKINLYILWGLNLLIWGLVVFHLLSTMDIPICFTKSHSHEISWVFEILRFFSTHFRNNQGKCLILTSPNPSGSTSFTMLHCRHHQPTCGMKCLKLAPWWNRWPLPAVHVDLWSQVSSCMAYRRRETTRMLRRNFRVTPTSTVTNPPDQILAIFSEPFGHFAAWPKRGKPVTQQVSLLNPQVPGQIPVVAFLGEENQSSSSCNRW